MRATHPQDPSFPPGRKRDNETPRSAVTRGRRHDRVSVGQIRRRRIAAVPFVGPGPCNAPSISRGRTGQAVYSRHGQLAMRIADLTLQSAPRSRSCAPDPPAQILRQRRIWCADQCAIPPESARTVSPRPIEVGDAIRRSGRLPPVAGHTNRQTSERSEVCGRFPGGFRVISCASYRFPRDVSRPPRS